MHRGTAQLLVGRLLAGGHLHQRRSAEEDLGALLDHHDVVAHARDVGAAGRRVAEDEGHGGQGRGRTAGEVAERPPSGDEQLGLGGQVGAARFHQVDDRQPVLEGDVRGAGPFAEGVGVHGPAPHRGVVGRDEALHPFDHADPDDRRGPDRVLGAPPGQGGQLEKGRVPVDQQLDPLAGQQLAPVPVALHIALATAGPGRGQLLVDPGECLFEGALVGPEGLRSRVDGGGEDGHGLGVWAAGSHCSRRRGKNRPHELSTASRRGPVPGGRRRVGVRRGDPHLPPGPGRGIDEDGPGRASPGPGSGGRLSAVVLAAGEGTRMRSARPKPLHRLCGRPMVLHVLDALAELSVARVVVVVGHRAEWVTKTLIEHAPPGMAIEFVEQVEQRGTGDAMAVALTGLPDEEGDDDGDVVVLPGDTPLLRPATLAALVHQHRVSDNAATLLTAELDDPTGYGRVVRGRDDSVARVVEHVDASDEELEVREINTSIYCFRRSVLAPSLRRLSPANAQGEHYLTDVVGVLYEAGHKVGSVLVDDTMEVAGVNDRAQLAVAEAELRDRINERWMRRGVTMWDPERTYIDVDVEIDPDVVMLPGVILQGSCVVGAHAELGPDVHLVDTVVGEGARWPPASAGAR